MTGKRRLRTSVHLELDRWGPAGSGRASVVSLGEAETYCRRLASSHYENFPLISWLLPKKLHQHFCNVYAYCRWADDLADEVNNPQESLQLLSWWNAELVQCYAGTTWHPVFVALQQTIDEFQIPLDPFEQLISAFEQDQRVWEYNTFDELLDYCRRSANPVGRLVLFVCGKHNEYTIHWSDLVCTGLQLANFWQDVNRDFNIGRVYLPQQDCRRFNYTRQDIENRVTNSAFLELMKFQVQRTRRYLFAFELLVLELPSRLQVEVELFARGGLKILDRIETIGYCVWDTRPTVSKWDILGLFLRSYSRRLLRQFGHHHVHPAEVDPEIDKVEAVQLRSLK